MARSTLKPAAAPSMLKTVKVVHTMVWAFFVTCIFAIWIFACQAEYFYATLSIAVVLGEVLVLILNGWRCPLASVAARYTGDRRDNFDIYLPQWLSDHTKAIFGTLYVAGIVFTFARWFSA